MVRFIWNMLFVLGLLSAISLLSTFETRQLCAAQEETSNADAELDRWRNSLLGVNLIVKQGKVQVSSIQSVASDGGFQLDDQLLRIGSVELRGDNLESLSRMMTQTPPGSRLPVVLIRDNETLETQVTTYRPETIDVDTIVNKIQRNPIIQSHLKGRDNAAFLRGLRERMLNAVEESMSPRLAQESINKMIDEIDLSHSAYVPACSYAQLSSETEGDIGITLRRFPFEGKHQFFIVDIKPGSPAFQSSLRLGDQVESINGTPIESSRRLVLVGEEHRYELYGCKADIGDEIHLQHRHTPQEELQSLSLRAIDAPLVQSVVDASARLIESQGSSFGYVRLWNLMTTDVGLAFQSHVESKFAHCDAIVLDLRGRGGQIAVVLQVESTIRKLKIPVVVITDELTRSAKEILAFRLKHLENTLVMGERTSGAVTAAGFTTLPSGNTLMLPAQSSASLKPFVKGEILEGVGVEPNERVDFFEPFCNGRDKLLEAAIRRAPYLLLY